MFEFKLNGTASAALQQGKDKAYAEKYRLRSKPITWVGANFDYKARKISEWTEIQEQHQKIQFLASPHYFSIYANVS